jgi:hypothetical protein
MEAQWHQALRNLLCPPSKFPPRTVIVGPELTLLRGSGSSNVASSSRTWGSGRGRGRYRCRWIPIRQLKHADPQDGSSTTAPQAEATEEVEETDDSENSEEEYRK